jgi:MFS family permease
MLGSITPLGERARGRRWSVTVAAYLGGTAVGGVAIGAGIGAVGGRLPWDWSVSARLLTVGAVAAIGALFDAGVLGLRLPTTARQVNEAWMSRYRGWLYGAGFGLQLGFGVVTVVTTSALYTSLVAALLTGTVRGGALVGLTFGLTRGAAIFAGGWVRRPDQLARVHALLSRSDRPTRAGALAAQGIVVAVIAAGALR